MKIIRLNTGIYCEQQTNGKVVVHTPKEYTFKVFHNLWWQRQKNKYFTI